MIQDVKIESLKAAPALGGAAYATITLNEWVAIITIIYVVVQMAILLHKHYYFVKEKKAKKNESV